MIRFYSTLAKVVTIYALLHPFVYLGAMWHAGRGMNQEIATDLEVADLVVDDMKLVNEDGTPLLAHRLYWESATSLPNILIALLTSVGLLAAGAVFHIAASRPQLADSDARDLQRSTGDSDAG